MSQNQPTDLRSAHRTGALVLRCLVLLVLALLVAAGPVAAQKARPLAAKDIKDLLQGGVPPARIAAIVAEKGIDFNLFDELESTFRKAGANDQLIDALRKASKSQPPPEQPDTPRGGAGILKIQSKPGEAQVYLNDEMKGMTSPEGDFRLSGLTAGTYHLRVSLAGYRSWENSLKITAGETETVFVTLDQKTVRPVVSLDSNLSSIQAGQSVVLTWTAENASDVDIEPVVGKVAATGSTTVYPRESTTYTLTAIGPGGVNSTTARVNVTAAVTPAPPPPVPGGIPGFPIPGASVEELKFFESGYGAPKLGERVYATRFDHKTTRFLNWELNLQCPKTTARYPLSINAMWYNPDGSLMHDQKMETAAEAGWTEPVFNFGRGWADPGNWKEGTYRVDLYVLGNKITSASFEIY